MQRVLSFPPSRDWGDQREFVSKRMCFAFMFALGFLAFLGGFLLGRFVFDKELELSRIKLKEASRNKEKVFGVYKNYSRFNVSVIIEGISESSIQKYFGLLTDQSSEDSASYNLREAEILRDHLISNGFDLVSPLSENHFQMAYPSSQFPNEAVIINDRGEAVFRMNDTRERYSGSARSLNTTVVEDSWGSVCDVAKTSEESLSFFDELCPFFFNLWAATSLLGKIGWYKEPFNVGAVINIRMGIGVPHPSSASALLCMKSCRRLCFLKGSIIYVNFGREEDYQYLDEAETRYRNRIIILRGGEITVAEKVANAVERSVKGILIFSDSEPAAYNELPLINPTELAKLQTRYGNHIDKWGGTIPILEISSRDVKEIFKKMSSHQFTPRSWKGKLRGYRIGPGFVDTTWKIRMKVSTVNVVQTFYTTLGAMRGSQEPDRFVMLTNEKDFANTNPQSTSVIMELVRVLGNLKAKGWTPHRSIVVAFWGAEGPNLHLSSHPVSVLNRILAKTVTYFEINSHDQAEGNLTLAAITPMLEKLFYESALAVPMEKLPADFLFPLDTNNLFIECGVPFIKMKQFGDKTLKEVATFWGVTIWRMIDSYKLPFSLDTYATFLAHSIDVIEKRFKTTAQEHSLLLDSLFQSVHRLIDAIKSFEDNWSRADASKSLEMRIMSDQLLDFSRFLICGRNSSPPNQRTGNSIFSKSLTGTDEKAGFGELQDLLQDVASAKNPQHFQQQIITHLASLVETIDLTRETLGDGLDTLITTDA